MAPAPVVVSPLVRFSRYAALLIGIKYGASHHNTLQKKEDDLMKLKEARKAEEVKKEEAAASSEGSIFD